MWTRWRTRGDEHGTVVVHHDEGDEGIGDGVEEARETFDLAVLIPNWNGEAVLGNCLTSLEHALDAQLQAQILVFDNGSTDASMEIIAEHANRLPLSTIRSETNVGYVAANNALFERSQAEFCLLLNNDTVVDGLLTHAVQLLRTSPHVGIAQGPLLTIDGTRIDSIGSLISRSGFLYHQCAGALFHTAPPSRPVFSVKGAAMYVRRSCITETGLFDPEAFAYFEESDLCWRAQLAGWGVIYDARLPVIRHVDGHTSPRLGARIYEFHSYKNRLRSILVNADRRTLPTMLTRHLGVCVCAAGGALLTRRWTGARSIAAGFAWNVKAARRTMRRRRMVQRLRQRSDSEIFSGTSHRMAWSDYLSLGRSYEAAKRRTEPKPLHPVRTKALVRRLRVWPQRR